MTIDEQILAALQKNNELLERFLETQTLRRNEFGLVDVNGVAHITGWGSAETCRKILKHIKTHYPEILSCRIIGKYYVSELHEIQRKINVDEISIKYYNKKPKNKAN